MTCSPGLARSTNECDNCDFAVIKVVCLSKTPKRTYTSFIILLRCSFLSRHYSSLCPRSSVHALPSSWKTWRYGTLQRSARKRPGLTPVDRFLWVWLSRVWSGWRSTLAMVQPETVIAWLRAGSRLFWTSKVRRGQPGRPVICREVRDLIRQMCRENPGWGVHCWLDIDSHRTYKCASTYAPPQAAASLSSPCGATTVWCCNGTTTIRSTSSRICFDGPTSAAETDRYHDSRGSCLTVFKGYGARVPRFSRKHVTIEKLR